MKNRHQFVDIMNYLSCAALDLCAGTQSQCFRQTAPLRESHVAIREGPKKNGKRANLALCFYKATGLTQA